MNVFRVNPTDQALTDAGEAYFWLNEHSPTAALRWYEGLLKAFRSLERNPLRCPLAPEHVFTQGQLTSYFQPNLQISSLVAWP